MTSSRTTKRLVNHGEFNERIDHLKSVHPEDNTKYSSDDIGAARLFYTTFGHRCKYNTDRGIWLIYDGKRWAMDKSETMIHELAQEFRDVLYHYTYTVAEAKRKEFEKNVTRLGDRNRRVKMIQDARPLCAAQENDFDRDPDLLNCQNGVLRLSTGELLQHDPALMLTKICNASYSPGTISQQWEAFVDQIMQGDHEKKEYLQRIAGYGISGTNEQETMFMLYGASSRNGKSTFLETIAYVLGDYADTISPESLAAGRNKNGAAASPDIAKLNGVRFLKCSEPEKKMVINPVLFKNLTGGDSITARELYQRPFTFRPQFKLFMNTNYLPTINDPTIFSSKRVNVLSFDRHFEDQEQDKSLKYRLRGEKNSSAVLTWLVEGYKTYLARGVVSPAAVMEATKQYEEKSDKIGMFLEECYIRDPDELVKLSNAYDLYRRWCSANGYGTDGKTSFKQYFMDRGLLEATGWTGKYTAHNVIKGYKPDPEEVHNYWDVVPQ